MKRYAAMMKNGDVIAVLMHDPEFRNSSKCKVTPFVRPLPKSYASTGIDEVRYETLLAFHEPVA